MKLTTKPFYLTREQEEKIRAAVSDMTDEEKVRQLFCVMGNSYSPEALEDIVRKGIGGVLFRPVKTMAETAEELKRLDRLSKYPLLHAANLEEGGAGAASDGTYFASQLQIAAADNDADTRAFAENCAAEGLRAGINWTFSPVADIDVNFQNPITNCRTFGSDGEKVAHHALIYTQILQTHGIAAAAKHFPGDGVDYRDQHLHPTYNSLSAERWRASYGMVYRRLIEAGLLSVMAGHICQPALQMEYNAALTYEDCMPATLSRELLEGVLRGELGFNGVIATDATIMGGFTQAMPRWKAIPTAIQSGCDMIVFTTDIHADIGYMLRGLENGLLTRERLDEAVTRIFALKEKVRVPAPGLLGDFAAARKVCAGHAVTLVKNKGGILPVTAEKYKTIRLSVLGDDETADGSLNGILKAQFEARGFSVEVYEPLKDDLCAPEDVPDGRLHLVALNYPPRSNRVTERVSWCAKHAMETPRFAQEKPYIYVSFANPYHLQDVPRARVYVNAYTATEAAAEAVASRLCGESEFTGADPVDPFCGLADTRF